MMRTNDTDESLTSTDFSDHHERFDDLIDIYGRTPPREKINRKLRVKGKNKKEKQRISSEAKLLSKKKSVKKIQTCNRKIRADITLNDNSYDQDEEDRKKKIKNATIKDKSRQCKRSLKLNRVNERNSKLDIEAANQYAQHDDEKSPTPLNNKQVFFGLTGLRVIQGKNRFLSLRSKRIEIDQPKSSKEFDIFPKINTENDDKSKIVSLNDRELFHLTFSQLINLGNKDKDKGYQRDKEKIRWQNEIKDLIWLELQAYHSDRSLVEQDEYLCKQRETIGSLLNEIIEYKYDPSSSSSSCTSDNSVSNDSGYSDESRSSCTGCLSMYCYHCGKSQVTALKQVESLLLRLEEAESLYPNSQAFSLDYELYKSKKFCDKIKAICLWYNITKYHRLKLHILGRLLNNLDNTKIEQNSLNIDDNNNDRKYLKSFIPLTPDESSFKEFDRHSYRKYIEEVLKTQGLAKSLNFLDRLYNTILQKTNLTLKKLNNNNDYYDNNDNWESQRYGVWSIEAKELNLPSYVSSFIFLSRVPLDVVHEYLRLRLEQKLINPEPLSIRELMREIKEGIGIACMHRDKFVENSKIVLSMIDESFHESLDTIPPDFQDVGEFDNNLKLVFEVYLNYFGSWIGIVLNNNICYKSIDNEWTFVKAITNKIKNGNNICVVKFCKIINTIIKEINEHLISCQCKINSIDSVSESGSSDVRFKYLSHAREWQSMFVDIGNRLERIINLTKSIIIEINKWQYESFELNNSIDNLKIVLLKPKYQMNNLIQQFTLKIDESKVFDTNEQDFNIIKIRLRQIFHQAFRMGFNYYKGLSDLFLLNEKFSIAYDLINFAKLWMNFVIKRCDRGRGIRPGWAYDGFKFLTIVCDPSNTKHLCDDDFENFKTAMDCCITHIIGDNNNSIESPVSSSPTVQSTIKSCSNIKSSDATTNNKRLISSLTDDNTTTEFDSTTMSQFDSKKHKKIMISLNKLDNKIDDNKKKYGLIGRLVDSVDRQNINDIKFKIKKITFTWHRGICIGQGAFGKVYTVVNNKTGKLLAMKEIQLQYGNRNSVNNVIKELQIFQGIEHKNLVRYYGMEIHREELLIFMELCTEGTLENFIKAHGTKLLDVFVRKYTHQLVLGVSVLHKHGIVHRDVKPANIFLTNQGNCLKLGDFGSAVKINTHVTMPGEIKGCVGTEAYMAPEVFMKNDSGRAADIWSIGCCVIEMSSGKRPWNDYNTRGQIMFKVGMGENPKIPDNISNDEDDFLHKCLQRNSKDRPTANKLLSHMFIRNFGDMNIE